MSVSAIIVTRGDVDMFPVLSTIPKEWEVLIWANGDLVYKPTYDEQTATWGFSAIEEKPDAPDLSVYGRYAAIQYASHDLIYVADDDCIVSDPSFLVEQWALVNANVPQIDNNGSFLVANMPQEFRPHYPDSCLVGFGACFHRELPARAFKRFREGIDGDDLNALGREADWNPKIRRTCDVVFTTLTPRVLVDVPVEVLPYAHDSNRMWKQPDHYGERTRVLEMARKVRDA